MFIMAALRFIMVLIICIPIGILMILLVRDLVGNLNKEIKNKKIEKRNSIDETKRTVYNSGGTRWSR